MKEEDTLEYGGEVSGIEIMNAEPTETHFVLAREPDCVCHVAFG